MVLNSQLYLTFSVAIVCKRRNLSCKMVSYNFTTVVLV